jgi:hypothetical protein
MKKKLLQNRYSSSSSSDDEIISCPSQCSSFSRIKRKRIENISNDNEKINKKEQIREHCHIRNNSKISLFIFSFIHRILFCFPLDSVG